MKAPLVVTSGTPSSRGLRLRRHVIHLAGCAGAGDVLFALDDDEVARALSDATGLDAAWCPACQDAAGAADPSPREQHAPMAREAAVVAVGAALAA